MLIKAFLNSFSIFLCGGLQKVIFAKGCSQYDNEGQTIKQTSYCVHGFRHEQNRALITSSGGKYVYKFSLHHILSGKGSKCVATGTIIPVLFGENSVLHIGW